MGFLPIVRVQLAQSPLSILKVQRPYQATFGVSYQGACYVPSPERLYDRFKGYIRAYCRRPGLHDVLYLGMRVASKGSTSHSS